MSRKVSESDIRRLVKTYCSDTQQEGLENLISGKIQMFVGSKLLGQYRDVPTPEPRRYGTPHKDLGKLTAKGKQSLFRKAEKNIYSSGPQKWKEAEEMIQRALKGEDISLCVRERGKTKRRDNSIEEAFREARRIAGEKLFKS